MKYRAIFSSLVGAPTETVDYADVSDCIGAANWFKSAKYDTILDFRVYAIPDCSPEELKTYRIDLIREIMKCRRLTGDDTGPRIFDWLYEMSYADLEKESKDMHEAVVRTVDDDVVTT
jgi:hypothetical protein